MRVYKADGSYVEDENDTEFGWYCRDIVIDENSPHYSERNRQTRELSRLCKSLDKSAFLPSPGGSVDLPAPTRTAPGPPVVELRPASHLPRRESVPRVLDAEEFRDIASERERLARCINPCGAEARTLLSVVYYAKYRTLAKREACEGLLGGVNAKATSPRSVLGPEDGGGIAGDLLEEVASGDDVLSLMMELIMDGAGCTVGDLVNEATAAADEAVVPRFVVETSDLGNSIRSTSTASSDRATAMERLLRGPSDRSDVLSSIGLGEEEKSIQCICEETYEMYKELVEIRRSFQEMEGRVATLKRATSELRDELKEVLYLEDIIHLLAGDVSRVKLKKLPFRVFHQGFEEADLIV